MEIILIKKKTFLFSKYIMDENNQEQKLKGRRKIILPDEDIDYIKKLRQLGLSVRKIQLNFYIEKGKYISIYMIKKVLRE